MIFQGVINKHFIELRILKEVPFKFLDLLILEKLLSIKIIQQKV